MFCCVLHFKLDVSLHRLPFPSLLLEAGFSELFTPFLPISSKALAQHLFAQVSLGGKFPQLCFFLSSNHSMSFLLPHQQSTPDLTPALCSFLPQGSTTENLDTLFIRSEICFENTALSHTTYPQYVDIVYMLISCIFSVFLEKTLANVLCCKQSNILHMYSVCHLKSHSFF